MAVPDDPQEVAAQFWAQLLGFEIASGEPPPGSPLWGMLLVRKLATSPAMPTEDASRVVRSYLDGRWTYCYPEIDERWGDPPAPGPRTHLHPDVGQPIRPDDETRPGS